MPETPIGEKGKSERKPLVIRVFAPMLVDPDSVSFRVAPVQRFARLSSMEFPNETLISTYGADSLQALQLAADIEPVLKRLSDHYDFYFPTGEGYFDEYEHPPSGRLQRAGTGHAGPVR